MPFSSMLTASSLLKLSRAVFRSPSRAFATGTVKWFNTEKGYGFISSDDGGPDLFAHNSGVVTDGERYLIDGEKVKFDSITDDSGRVKATNITQPNGDPLVRRKYGLGEHQTRSAPQGPGYVGQSGARGPNKPNYQSGGYGNRPNQRQGGHAGGRSENRRPPRDDMYDDTPTTFTAEDYDNDPSQHFGPDDYPMDDDIDENDPEMIAFSKEMERKARDLYILEYKRKGKGTERGDKHYFGDFNEEELQWAELGIIPPTRYVEDTNPMFAQGPIPEEHKEKYDKERAAHLEAVAIKEKADAEEAERLARERRERGEPEPEPYKRKSKYPRFEMTEEMEIHNTAITMRNEMGCSMAEARRAAIIDLRKRDEKNFADNLEALKEYRLHTEDIEVLVNEIYVPVKEELDGSLGEESRLAALEAIEMAKEREKLEKGEKVKEEKETPDAVSA